MMGEEEETGGRGDDRLEFKDCGGKGGMREWARSRSKRGCAHLQQGGGGGAGVGGEECHEQAEHAGAGWGGRRVGRLLGP